jgi:predicted nucleic acid-binding protein
MESGPGLQGRWASLAELYYGVEKSSRRAQNLQVVEEFVSRLEALPFSVEAAAHYGQVRAELERVGRTHPRSADRELGVDAIED